MAELVFISALLASGIRLAAPIALAAVGETLAQRSGVLNVGLEGIMLTGAFLAVLFAVLTGSPWGGLAAAIIGGAMLGALHAFFVVRLKVDQIVAGIALIFLGLGISGYGYRLTLAQAGAIRVPGFDRINLFGLGDLPVIGPVLFNHHVLVYLAVAAAVGLAWVFANSRLGVMIKAVGENPHAADTAGIGVDRLRAVCVTIGGAFAGMGGAFLSTAQLSGFVENMVAGRGFIAIACVVFARWNPVAAISIALLFGIADAAQIRLQTLYPGIPYQFLVIAPYVVAIISLTVASRSARMPAALGVPFRA